MLSTRVSIQWPPEAAEEDTKTIVTTTQELHFVDIRTYKQYYPCKDQDSQPFDTIFQWCSSGIEKSIPGTSKIQFEQEISSIAISKALRNNEPLRPPEPDIGDFSSIPNSSDRKETGRMTNPATDKVQDYIEIWRSLDPVSHSPDVEVLEKVDNGQCDVFTLKVSDNDFEGKLVRVGSWLQGVIYDKSNKKTPLHVIQSHFSDGKWNNVIEYGRIEWFPVDFAGSLNDSVTLHRLEWKCIEA